MSANTRNRIKDIVLSESQNSLEWSFDEYRPSDEIAEKIMQSIFDTSNDIFIKGKGFVLDSKYSMSKKDSRVGLISNIMGLSTMLELNGMGCNLGKYSKQFSFLIESVFKHIYQNEQTDSLCFDATPYIDFSEVGVNSFVESISKVLIVMTDLRQMLMIPERCQNIDFKLTINENIITQTAQLIPFVEKLLIDAMKALSDACIINTEPFPYKIKNKVVERLMFPSEVRYKGWGYKDFGDDHDSEQMPSLYFTYHATNAFINFYMAFQKIFVEYDNPDVEACKAVYRENNPEVLKVIELDREFYNSNIELINRLRIQTSSAGRFFESRTTENNIDLTIEWLDSNLNKLPYNTLKNGQKNNCVIDTLLYIAILFNGGVDDDYEFMDYKELIYSNLNYIVENIQKTLFTFRRNENDDLICSYKLLFNEIYGEDYRGETKKLREALDGVGVYDIVPLLCNTYSIISRYLINYPQIEMKKFLSIIMEDVYYRKEDDTAWYWPLKSFNVNNNLYYILALENFYEYHEIYEKKFIGNAREYERLQKEISDKEAQIGINEEVHRNAISEKNQEIQNIINQYEEKLREAEEKYANKVSRLDAEVIDLIDSELNKRFEAHFRQALEKMIHHSIEFAIASSGTTLDPDSVAETLQHEYPDALLLQKISKLSDLAFVAMHGGDYSGMKTPFESLDEKYISRIADKIVVEYKK